MPKPELDLSAFEVVLAPGGEVFEVTSFVGLTEGDDGQADATALVHGLNDRFDFGAGRKRFSEICAAGRAELRRRNEAPSGALLAGNGKLDEHAVALDAPATLPLTRMPVTTALPRVASRAAARPERRKELPRSVASRWE